MTDEEAHRLRRENEYLKARCAQLQGDVTDLAAQLHRLQQHAAPTVARPPFDVQHALRRALAWS